MKRTTVKLPDELDARLRHESAVSGRTVSDLTRRAIEIYLDGEGPHERRRLMAAGAGRSGTRDTADRIEAILAKELGPSRS